jgi:hypothetical protein
MNQQLVSRVLLNRWADRKNGPIGVLNVNTLIDDTKPAAQLDILEDLVKSGAEELEQVWNNEVEKMLPHVFKLLDDDELLKPRNLQYLTVLKDCMALHWARSFAIKVMVDRLKDHFGSKIADHVLSKFPVQSVARAFSGFYIPELRVEQFARDSVPRAFEKDLEQGFLRDQLLKLFTEAKKRIASFGIEIGVALKSEFVLGDCPVVTYDKDTDRAGVLFGATWSDANAIFMPAGPRHVIALAKENRRRELLEGEVVSVNKLEIRAAFQEIYFRSDSGLGSVIAEALRESNEQLESADPTHGHDGRP